jgi:hypothetical protein
MYDLRCTMYDVAPQALVVDIDFTAKPQGREEIDITAHRDFAP